MAKPLKKPKIIKIFHSRFWPVILSGLIAPGLGQISNKENKKGIFLLGSSLGSLFWFSRLVTEHLKTILPGEPESWTHDKTVLKEALRVMVDKNPSMFLSFQILILTIWIYSMVDAYLGSKKK